MNEIPVTHAFEHTLVPSPGCVLRIISSGRLSGSKRKPVPRCPLPCEPRRHLRIYCPGPARQVGPRAGHWAIGVFIFYVVGGEAPCSCPNRQRSLTEERHHPSIAP